MKNDMLDNYALLNNRTKQLAPPPPPPPKKKKKEEEEGRNQTAEPKTDTCSTSHFSPCNCLSVVLWLKKGLQRKFACGVFRNKYRTF